MSAMMDGIFDRAYKMLAEAKLLGRPPRGIAMPFGVIELDAWRWRVSGDVLQALYDAMPPPFPIPNPKSGDDVTRRLFGLTLVEDRALPPNAIVLEGPQ
jgi:hypothetical protein